MESAIKFQNNLGLLADTFSINVVSESEQLSMWTSASFQLDNIEQANFDYLYHQVKIDGKYWNEEELKIRFIGGLFAIARIDVDDKIKVFYERPLSNMFAKFKYE